MDLRRRMELLTEAALPDREQGMPKYRRSVPVGNRPITSMGIAQARADVETMLQLAHLYVAPGEPLSELF